MRIAHLIIATGPKYHQFVNPLIQSANQFFVPHDTVLWTDGNFVSHSGLTVIRQPCLGFPLETLHRYHTFLSQIALLSGYDMVFYSDCDMRFVSPVALSDVIADGIVATRHPGFMVSRTHPKWGLTHTTGTPERNHQSAAYIPRDAKNVYYCGGFNGGRTEKFIEMARKIRQMVDQDHDNGFTAIWHDESHLNRYLYDNPPARVLTPSFCYPEDYDGGYGWAPTDYPPVLIALDKRKKRSPQWLL